MAQTDPATTGEQVSTNCVDVSQVDGYDRDATDAELRAARKLAEKSADVFDSEPVTAKVIPFSSTDTVSVRVYEALSMYHARRAVKGEPFEITGMLAYGHGGCRIDLTPTDNDD